MPKSGGLSSEKARSPYRHRMSFHLVVRETLEYKALEYEALEYENNYCKHKRRSKHGISPGMILGHLPSAKHGPSKDNNAKNKHTFSDNNTKNKCSDDNTVRRLDRSYYVPPPRIQSRVANCLRICIHKSQCIQISLTNFNI